MGINYALAVTDFFRTPRWGLTLLFGFICVWIPIVGMMVLQGYLMRRLLEVREGHPPEDLDFGNFVIHLKEGLWPFLASLILAIAIIPLYFGLFVPPMLGAMTESEIWVGVGIVVGILIFFVGLTAMMIVMVPVLLRAFLMQDVVKAFHWPFIWAFLKSEGLGMMLSLTVVMVGGCVAMMFGFLVFCIGAYVVLVVYQFSWFHVKMQHYDRFLRRGGEPIPLAAPLLEPLPTSPRFVAVKPPPLKGPEEVGEQSPQ